MALRFLPPDDVAPPPKPSAATERQLEIARAVRKHGVSGAARVLGIDRTNVQRALSRLRRAGARVREAEVRRYILTAAQDGDDTQLHDAFWANLLAYAEHLGAEVMVAPFTYNKAVFGDHETRNGVFRPEVAPFLRYDQVDLGPIVFCAEMNTLPTAVQPLSGLEAYTGPKWGVFPHAKLALLTVPVAVDRPAKQIMTTGCVTRPNYIEKKAGLKARFHHIIGAVLVEIDEEDRVWCRQINAAADGSFYDIAPRGVLLVADGRVTTGHRAEAINWADIHQEKMDPVVADGAWGLDVETGECRPAPDTMIDALQPRHQFYHDLFDFRRRNHHSIKDHHHRFRMNLDARDSVEADVVEVCRFVRATQRPWCQSVLIFSNHDDALTKWLKTADFREDPANAVFFLRCQLAMYEAIERDDQEFNIFWWALQRADPQRMADVAFVDDDQSFVICQASGGIECGMHGHLGINGARGNAVQFTKTAMRINKGHDHSPSIHAGVYTAGVCNLDQGYNRGLSGWAQTHIVTYPNGKRTLVTMQDGQWCAGSGHTMAAT